MQNEVRQEMNRHLHVAVIIPLAMALACAALVAQERQASPPDPAQRLAVSVAPNPVATRTEGGVYVFVQVVDAKGDPVKTTASPASPLVITLTSSDPSVLKPYGGRNVVTLSGPTCGHGEFSADKAGAVSVTASAPGFAPASESISVVSGGAAPTKVRLYAVPPRVAPGCRAVFLVQMLDANGRPATPQYHTPLALDSSSPQVVSGDKALYFLRDFTAQQASLYVRDGIGTTALTASGKGLASEPATFAIVPLAIPAPAPAAPQALPPPAPQISPDALEQQGYTLGAEAAERAQTDAANAENVIAERYRQAMALSSDGSMQQRVTDAFRRGYKARASAIAPPAQIPSAQTSPAQAPPAGQAAGAAPRIFEVTAARSVAWGKPVGPAGTFTPDTNPIYVWFQYEGWPAGTKITSVWYYLDTVTPTRIEQATATTGQAASFGQFSLELASGKVWPEGAYRVDLLVDGPRPAWRRPTRPATRTRVSGSNSLCRMDGPRMTRCRPPICR